MSNPYEGDSKNFVPGIKGTNTPGGDGVLGNSQDGIGVHGVSENSLRVFCPSVTSVAVGGYSGTPPAVLPIGGKGNFPPLAPKREVFHGIFSSR
jgi:hypothetical protein